MDHYKILGLSRDATKDEIKEAYRRLALKFHPDKHSQSSKDVRDGATLKFKQVSEAYEVLIDDRKRTGYNLSRSGGGRDGFPSSGYGYNGDFYYGQRKSRARSGFESSRSGGFDLNVVFRFFTTRSFLLNLAFAGVLLGGAVAIERSGNAIWQMNNSGKSFEDAMESIEKMKSQKKC